MQAKGRYVRDDVVAGDEDFQGVNDNDDQGILSGDGGVADQGPN
jgi:hypothetical protein